MDHSSMGAVAALTALGLCGSLRAQAVIESLSGDGPSHFFGFAISATADLDGDGCADYAIGAPGADVPFLNAGRVHIVSGRTATTIHTLVGATTDAHLGASLAGVGDLDGDGIPELAIGADAEVVAGLDVGVVHVVSGAGFAPLLALIGTGADDIFGVAVAGPGDLDGDGVPDIAIGAAFDDDAGMESGSASIRSGATGQELFLTVGSTAGDRFGRSLAGAGDIDLDGRADVVVGAIQGAHGPGFARVYSGSTGAVLRTYVGASLFDEFGYAIADVGDVDLDGSTDTIIGSRYADANGVNSGSIRLHSGRSGALLAFLAGSAANERFGQSVAGLGDIDGDGRADFIVGASAADSPFVDAGAIRAFSGNSSSLLFAIHGQSQGEQLGRAVAGVGDVNGDGMPDAIGGAWHANVNGIESGAAYVTSSTCASVTSYGSGCAASGAAPRLAVNGCVTPGAEATIAIDGLATGAAVLIVVGAAPAALPIGGGCSSWVAPPFVSLAFSTAASSLAFAIPLPSGAPLPEFRMQVFAAKPAGVMTSNALWISP